MAGRVLITGAVGQIGSALVPALRQKHGIENVVATYHRTKPEGELASGIWVRLDTTNKAALAEVVTEIYHLASLLSATSEAHPDLAWDANLTSLKHVLDVSREQGVSKIFWPSSIAHCMHSGKPCYLRPQILEPTGLYGVTKVAGELLCQYYNLRYKLDVRSLRYPGIISVETLPGGGTTDYAVAIFYEALQHHKYKCYLRADSMLPMMYMPDAIKATLDLMAAPAECITVRTSYNLAAFSVTPTLLADTIKNSVRDFSISYEIDPVRQRLADSWPDSIDDSSARKDWGWKPAYDLNRMTLEVLPLLAKKLGVPTPL